MALFAQRYITTAVVKTVHGAGADFPDLVVAMQWLGQYIITASGSVTFMVAPGKWTYTTTVEVNHPNANRVSIQGGALLGGTPTRANVSVTGYKTSGDGSAQITYFRSVYATELSFAGGITGFRFLRGGATLRYLLITGSQTAATGYRQGIGIDVQAYLQFDGLAIWGFGSYGVNINQAGMRGLTSLSICIAYCGIGLELDTGWFEAGPWALLSYPDQIVTECIIVSCNRGVVSYAGAAFMGVLTLKGHDAPAGNGGANLETGSQFITAHNSMVSINRPTGICSVSGSVLIMQYSFINNNANFGVTCQGGQVGLDYSNITGNGQFDLYSFSNGFIEAVGAAFGPVTPPLNTFANGLGYIYA
jgi:hypothetical protein